MDNGNNDQRHEILKNLLEKRKKLEIELNLVNASLSFESSLTNFRRCNEVEISFRRLDANNKSGYVLSSLIYSKQSFLNLIEAILNENKRD